MKCLRFILVVVPLFWTQAQVPQVVTPKEETAQTQPSAPAPKIDIVVKKGKDRSKTSSASTLETFEFAVQVKALAYETKVEGAIVELYILSVSNANPNMFNVIHASQEKFDLSSTPYSISTPLLQVKYSKTGGGAKLGGYLVIVTDAEGNLLDTKATRTSFVREMERIRTAPVSTSTKKSLRL